LRDVQTSRRVSSSAWALRRAVSVEVAMTRAASTCRSVAVPSWGLESMTQDVRKREPSGSSMAVRGHGEARYSSMAGLPTGWSCRRVTTLLAGPSPRARGRTEAARRCDFGIAVEQRRARIGPRAAGGRCRVTNLQQRGDQGSDPSPRRMLGGIDLVSNISLSIGDYQRLSAVGIPPLPSPSGWSFSNRPRCCRGAVAPLTRTHGK